MQHECLPISKDGIRIRYGERPDFVLVSGDAYVDHPSFGVAIISRYLEAYGFKVGILAQPDWKSVASFKQLGRPRLGFLVTAGNLDSMVNHYSVSKKRRNRDVYSPGGKPGRRPDRACIVYAQKIKEAYKKVPVILGGMEASLRRLAHYDYWEDRVRRSILLDSRADLLVYGMGEKPILEIAEALESGIDISYLTYIRGTVYSYSQGEELPEGKVLPSYDELLASRKQFARSFFMQYRHTDSVNGEVLIEPYRSTFVVQNPPAEPLSTEELDRIYRLPFTRTYHPVYDKEGGVPAIEEVRFSLVSVRGCFGGCSFCSLHFHQGKMVQPRSVEAIVEEARELTRDPEFKGYLHDVGGPTANFRGPACRRQLRHGPCLDRRCLTPEPCPHLEVDHSEYRRLLQELRNLDGVKKVFIRSGIRYDYLIYDEDPSFMKELCRHHVSGQLKVAPEHIDSGVLKLMGKPPVEIYHKFVRKYQDINWELGKEQYLVPYLMSSHPGSDLQAAVRLAEYLRDTGHVPEQVQDFYPTPGTLSTCMYYTGLDPFTMQEVYVPRSPREKAMQRALIQYRNPKNYRLVHEALNQASRKDLIGYGSQCLIKPPRGNKPKNRQNALLK